MIIGCGGAGKSTLARALSEKLQLPMVHLDREYWHPNWVESSKEEWAARMHELVSEDTWVLDGNYGGTMDIRLAVADTVIFLAYSRWVCTYGVLSRWWRNRGKTRSDMAEGCYEKMDWAFLRYVWHYNDTRKPGILKKLSIINENRPPDAHATVYVFKNRKEAEVFLKRLG